VGREEIVFDGAAEDEEREQRTFVSEWKKKEKRSLGSAPLERRLPARGGGGKKKSGKACAPSERLRHEGQRKTAATVWKMKRRGGEIPARRQEPELKRVRTRG